MKFTLKFDVQELDRGQVDVTMQVLKGTTIVDTVELTDTTSTLTTFYARRAVENLFQEMEDARNDRANAEAEPTASARTEDEG